MPYAQISLTSNLSGIEDVPAADMQLQKFATCGAS